MTVTKRNGNISSRTTVKFTSASSRRKPNALHDRLIKLMLRPGGATMHDTWNAGFYFPAIVALKLAARRGLRTDIVKKKGELTRYYARRPIAKRRNR